MPCLLEVRIQQELDAMHQADCLVLKFFQSELEIGSQVDKLSGTCSIRTFYGNFTAEFLYYFVDIFAYEGLFVLFLLCHSVGITSPCIGIVPARATVFHVFPSPLRIISGVLPIHVPLTGVCDSEIIMRG